MLNSAQSALAVATNAAYDHVCGHIRGDGEKIGLILMDREMPELDGLVTTQVLRAAVQSVLVMTYLVELFSLQSTTRFN